MYFEEEKEDIHKQCSRKEENKNQHIKYSIEIHITTERRKAHLQREVLTLHTTSSNNILTSNLSFQRISFLLNQSWMYRGII